MSESAFNRLMGEPLKEFAELAPKYNTTSQRMVGWATTGLLAADKQTRVKLEHVRRGKQWVTSERAVAAFFRALTIDTTTEGDAA